MKIPTDLTPLGPEMAFKMPEGECLPMWVRDDEHGKWRLVGITSFDGRKAKTILGYPWNQCALLEGCPIPESALVNKPDRLMTWREVSELLGRFNWGESVYSGGYCSAIHVPYGSENKPWELSLRKWGSDELVRPMYSLLLAARKEAGV